MKHYFVLVNQFNGKYLAVIHDGKPFYTDKLYKAKKFRFRDNAVEYLLSREKCLREQIFFLKEIFDFTKNYF